MIINYNKHYSIMLQHYSISGMTDGAIKYPPATVPIFPFVFATSLSSFCSPSYPFLLSCSPMWIFKRTRRKLNVLLNGIPRAVLWPCFNRKRPGPSKALNKRRRRDECSAKACRPYEQWNDATYYYTGVTFVMNVKRHEKSKMYASLSLSLFFFPRWKLFIYDCL